MSPIGPISCAPHAHGSGELESEHRNSVWVQRQAGLKWRYFRSVHCSWVRYSEGSGHLGVANQPVPARGAAY